MPVITPTPLIQSQLDRRDAAQAELDALVAAPLAEGRSAETRGDFTPEESARFEELTTEIHARDLQIEKLSEAHRQSTVAAERREQLGLGSGEPTGVSHVNSTERQYRRGAGLDEPRYFNDLARAAVLHDQFAAARLLRHSSEMDIYCRDNPTSVAAKSLRQLQHRMGIDPEFRSGLTTSVGSGGTLLPPEYLLDMLVEFPRQQRVLADLVRKMDLPRGPMTIELPKITAGTGVNAQATQNTSVTETDLTDAYVTANVQTVAGQQTLALQLVEQSAVPYDEIVFGDLNAAREQTVEQYVVQGTGTSGQFTGVVNVSGVNAQTYTSGSPTGIGAYPFLGQAKAQVFDAIKRPADMFLMTPDRWAWFEVASDDNGRPLVPPAESGSFNAIGVVDGQLVNGPKPVGRLFGLPVYVTSEIPTNLGGSTNQDEIIALSSKDLILWESTPVARALPQTLGNQLSVLLQVYEYGAFMPNRLPGAISLLGGTGFTTPAF